MPGYRDDRSLELTILQTAFVMAIEKKPVFLPNLSANAQDFCQKPGFCI
jgi:hypothetical protein